MSSWKTEVYRMAFYLITPVVVYYFFNMDQEYHYNKIQKVIDDIRTPEVRQNEKIFAEFLKENRKKRDQELLNELDNLQKKQ